MNNNTTLPAAIVLAIAIALGGWFVGHGFSQARLGDRYVTVKGLSERTVKSDLALWPIRFVVSGNELNAAQSQLKAQAATVMQFLQEQGIPQKDVELQSLQVTDKNAQSYDAGNYKTRFVIAQTVMVRSVDVDRIATASQQLSRLVEAGVILNSEFGPTGPSYLFTKLNEVKPAMIAEATKSARAGAEQFAKDSGSSVGGIRTASQGLFQILPRDDAPGLQQEKEMYKTLRVVTTIDYLLAS
jgi:hypothetical protein